MKPMKQEALLASILFAALFLASPVAAQKAAPKAQLVADKGKLLILIDAQNVGSEDFQINSTGTGWTSHAEVKIQIPGANVSKLTSTLLLGPQNNPTRYEWSLQADKKTGGSVVFEGGNANVELRQEGAAPYTQTHMFGDQS
ncbi:MAG: hypothetical protein HY046_05375, partial [Acidobacteria bacterium]|nr:hypothetical protein [Acidobacteriota bacterium]